MGINVGSAQGESVNDVSVIEHRAIVSPMLG